MSAIDRDKAFCLVTAREILRRLQSRPAIATMIRVASPTLPPDYVFRAVAGALRSAFNTTDASDDADAIETVAAALHKHGVTWAELEEQA